MAGAVPKSMSLISVQPWSSEATSSPRLLNWSDLLADEYWFSELPMLAKFVGCPRKD